MNAKTSVVLGRLVARVGTERVGPPAELREPFDSGPPAPAARAGSPRAGASAEARPRGAPAGAVDALRARLAGSSAREHVVLDFLEDDLREARAALSAVAAWVVNVEAALADADPSQGRLLSLALGGGPGERVDYLATTLASVRRRIAQVAARM